MLCDSWATMVVQTSFARFRVVTAQGFCRVISRVCCTMLAAGDSHSGEGCSKTAHVNSFPGLSNVGSGGLSLGVWGVGDTRGGMLSTYLLLSLPSSSGRILTCLWRQLRISPNDPDFGDDLSGHIDFRPRIFRHSSFPRVGAVDFSPITTRCRASMGGHTPFHLVIYQLPGRSYDHWQHGKIHHHGGLWW
jgi:hypothetical protein